MAEEEKESGASPETDPDPDTGDPMPIVVALRLKPNPNNKPVALLADIGQNSVKINHVDRAFNYVFNESTSQDTLYNTTFGDFVKMVTVGYDLTIVGCGQSESGKSYSLFGPDLSMAMNESDLGVAYRFLRSLFQRLEGQHFRVKVSMAALDGDLARDLLSQGTMTSALKEEDSRYSLEGLSRIECNSVQDVFTLIDNGRHLHQMRKKMMTEFKSYSHNILTAELKVGKYESRVRFFDLVPSESISDGQNGLLALHTMVSMQGEKKMNIPTERLFQNSKPILVQLLSDAFRGSALTVLLACVSTLEADVQETESVLEFASRAMNVVNNPYPRFNGDDEDDDEDLRSSSANEGSIPQLQIPQEINEKPVSGSGGGATVPMDPVHLYNMQLQQALNQQLLLAQLQQLQLMQQPVVPIQLQNWSMSENNPLILSEDSSSTLPINLSSEEQVENNHQEEPPHLNNNNNNIIYNNHHQPYAAKPKLACIKEESENSSSLNSKRTANNVMGSVETEHSESEFEEEEEEEFDSEEEINSECSIFSIDERDLEILPELLAKFESDNRDLVSRWENEDIVGGIPPPEASSTPKVDRCDRDFGLLRRVQDRAREKLRQLEDSRFATSSKLNELSFQVERMEKSRGHQKVDLDEEEEYSALRRAMEKAAEEEQRLIDYKEETYEMLALVDEAVEHKSKVQRGVKSHLMDGLEYLDKAVLDEILADMNREELVLNYLGSVNRTVKAKADSRRIEAEGEQYREKYVKMSEKYRNLKKTMCEMTMDHKTKLNRQVMENEKKMKHLIERNKSLEKSKAMLLEFYRAHKTCDVKVEAKNENPKVKIKLKH